MTDTHRSPAPSPAQDPASAMDQALDWLIVLDSPSEEQTRQFHALARRRSVACRGVRQGSGDLGRPASRCNARKAWPPGRRK